SWATPFTASGFAIINARLRAAHKPPLGLLNPLLYQLPKAAFYDITSGSNDLYGQGCCSATVGYDFASGLGAPNFDQILAAIPPPR
ncbi:MAG: peptidase S53, partial [Actinomycetes bacterium]